MSSKFFTKSNYDFDDDQSAVVITILPDSSIKISKKKLGIKDRKLKKSIDDDCEEVFEKKKVSHTMLPPLYLISDKELPEVEEIEKVDKIEKVENLTKKKDKKKDKKKKDKKSEKRRR